jgi:NADH-quinone oxidoreductase subunit F
MIMDDTVDMLRVVRRLTEFYAHESCGKCTPCREGTTWMVQILSRLERHEGDASDVDTLLDACDNIFGRAFCALADGAVSPIKSGIEFFRKEFIPVESLGQRWRADDATLPPTEFSPPTGSFPPVTGSPPAGLPPATGSLPDTDTGRLRRSAVTP